ncbi:hypothetical protein EYF80_003495 [Liparis tanakae]|uniref:Uncharacterized protein n=1 Tax=Liparis tanakae TaxID=230148 RepID=A0A4Z2J8P9_9TELE|nr:hypothetical protein EYF80_003495 [Liparis tanakae]
MADWFMEECMMCLGEEVSEVHVYTAPSVPPLPGTAAGDRGPVREVVTLAGEPTGDGEGPRMPGKWGDVCGEKGDWAGLLCSP